MKFLFYCFAFLSASAAVAQVTLPIDSSTNKVTYYEVVKVDTALKKDVLFMNAEKWTENKLQVQELKADSHKIVCTGEMLMTESKGLLEKNSGRFTYDFIIEIKDGRYRYMFTNFVYLKFTTDKNGKKQYEHRKKIEEPKAAGWNRLWNKHKATLDLRIKAMITDLKENMAVNPKLAPVEQKIKKKSTDW